MQHNVYLALHQLGIGPYYRRGIQEYSRTHTGWNFARYNVGWLCDRPQDISFPNAHGCIVQIVDDPYHRAYERYKHLPTVNLHGGMPYPGLPAQVGVSDRAIGKKAAQYLADLGFSNFAYLGLPGWSFCRGRFAGFYKELKKRGFRVERFRHFAKYPHVEVERPGIIPWETEFVNWLHSLPKPVAIFASDDHRASWVSQACSILHLNIPEDVAILGCNDDEVECISNDHPVSSLRIPCIKAGYEAARMLHKILKGEPLEKTPLLLEPESVTKRASTDVLLIKDKRVATAINYIRSEACRGLSTEDVARRAGLSRRSLDSQFSEILGRTVFQEIRRVQFEHIQKLLRETNSTLETIASQSGFRSGIHLSLAFKERYSQTPGDYRRKYSRF